MFSAIKSFIVRVGVEDADDAATRSKKNTLTLASLFGASSLVFWAGWMFYFKEPSAGTLWLVYAGFLFTVLVLWGITKKGFHIAGAAFIISLLVFPLILGLIIGTYAGFGGAWYAILTMLAAYIYYPGNFRMFFAAAIITVFAGLSFDAFSVPTKNFPPLFYSILYGASFMVLGGITVMMLIQVMRERDLAYRKIHDEREKADSLLRNILPAKIVSRLKHGEEVIADQLDQVSVLFADIVGFTPLSSRMSAVELVELLDEVFSHIDALVEKYGLEKIKTIGDCYMAASGVPLSRSDHASAITAMALEFRDYAVHNSFRGHKLSFRIGINSGDLVAGVIGKKKFAYDLWGDTVNTASRMESHGLENIIQVTESTYNLVKDDFICEFRGKIEVKGKGQIAVYKVECRAYETAALKASF
jgi:adenylate cyclase